MSRKWQTDPPLRVGSVWGSAAPALCLLERVKFIKPLSINWVLLFSSITQFRCTLTSAHNYKPILPHSCAMGPSARCARSLNHAQSQQWLHWFVIHTDTHTHTLVCFFLNLPSSWHPPLRPFAPHIWSHFLRMCLCQHGMNPNEINMLLADIWL